MTTEIIEQFRRQYPEAAIVPVRQVLDAATFAGQKAKMEAQNRQGGAIGVVWVSPQEIVLVKRSGLHAGWAIIGGSVEQGEDFAATFVRENQEETGLEVTIARLVEIEDKVFISPNGEELPMPVAFFEATAYGQTPTEIAEAREEELEAHVFTIEALPEDMILNDREKVLRCVRERERGQDLPLR